MLLVTLVTSMIPASALADDGLGAIPGAEENNGGVDVDDSVEGEITDDKNQNIDALLPNDGDMAADGESAATEEMTAEPEAVVTVPTISYQAHVSWVGWQDIMKDGATAGTTGKSRAVEAMKIDLSNKEYTGDIVYSAYVSGSGWQGEVKNNGVAGTTGQKKQIEAIKINLSAPQGIDVYYRVHVANVGWLGWAKNGDQAGSVNYGYAIEALEIRLVGPGDTPPAPTIPAFKQPAIGYSTHIQNVGWQARKYDGEVSGTTGQSLRIEALKIDLLDTGYSGGITYEAHVQNVGWQGSRDSGGIAGTSGKSLRIEALKISLNGAVANEYSVYYRVHVQNIGWLNWAHDGESAGTVESSLRIESLQIQLVKKGTQAPTGSGLSYYPKASLSYKAHVQNVGWQDAASDGATAGTTGRALRVESISMTLNSQFSGGVKYNAHVQNVGWQGEKSDGAEAGTTGKKLQIEAITISLTGEVAKYYDVYYRVHSAEYGWLGWAKNGAKAGTATVGYRMEAFQVKIVAKGGIAPGSTAGAYKTEPALAPPFQAMNAYAQGIGSSTPWLIVIDTWNNVLGVYSGSWGNWRLTQSWICSTGLPGSPTIKGLYSMGIRGYSFGSGFSCYWYTQIRGDYLIHSLPYYQGTNRLMENTLGRPGSAGCVRLDINNAKWIYDHIPAGTAIYIY